MAFSDDGAQRQLLGTTRRALFLTIPRDQDGMVGLGAMKIPKTAEAFSLEERIV